MDMLGSSTLGHTSLSVGGLGELGLEHHEHLHPHQPLPPHRPLSPPSHHHHSHPTVDSTYSPSSPLPSSTVKIKPGESRFSLCSVHVFSFVVSED